MLRRFDVQDGRLKPVDEGAGAVVWWDLHRPTPDEERTVETCLGLELPTFDEMQEIETSARLYVEDGACFMTAQVPSHTDAEQASSAPVTFILSGQRLVTIRHSEPRAFTTFPQRAAKSDLGLGDGKTVLVALLEAMIGRLADILERVGRDMDALSRSVFGQGGAETRKGSRYKTTLETIGRKGDLTSNIRESLASFERLLAFLGPKLGASSGSANEDLAIIALDIRSLSDHAGFLAQKVTLLLDATLGLISIEQNGIIKIFSVASVVFLPPTLVASIYGMNFDVMPELHWHYGYPLALGAMVLSAALPYLYFKKRGWL
ncbi:MAG: magnesium transporter CorA family protein [Paracoccus sp. (in: a-proteobacteria)]|nr:magnesium transporter CorA family protein [Paracoccus sp. (in: a-proteobacteria)]